MIHLFPCHIKNRADCRLKHSYELHPLRSLLSSVLGHFGLFSKVRSDEGPNWPRTEVP